MAWPYEYTPYIWPALSSVAVLVVLGICAIRRRAAPGALPFVILVTCGILWVLANALELATTDDATRILWFEFQASVLIPLVTAALCFVLEYAGLRRWLTCRMLALFAVAPLAVVLLIFTNGVHHLVWTRVWFDDSIRANPGPAYWGAVAYSYFLTLLHLIVLARLFVRSPRHRWIAGGLILSPVLLRGTYLAHMANWRPLGPLDPMVVALNVGLLPYALALFRFRMFEVVPIARDTVIERMADGMMVLDAEDRIADINGRAQSVLGTVKSKANGAQVADVLHAYPDLLRLVHNGDETQGEISCGDTHARWCHVSISPLFDERGFHLGRLIWFHDITEQRRAQAQVLEHQRTLAMLKERELLARELHDGIGQTLAAAQLQVKSASDLLARGETALAETCLLHLTEVTQRAKESIREYLHGVKIRSSPEQGLLATLRQYFDHYSHNYGIHIELIAPPELQERRIDSTVELQLQPIIQEALTNIRKHSGASSARVIFARCDDQVRVTVEDDGRGFDPHEIDEMQGFGLRSMRGRAEAVGARLEIISSAGKGTQVIVQVPWRKEET